MKNRCGWRDVLLRWRTQDGNYLGFESNASPIIDDNGEVVGFQGVDRDVTDRLRIEAELQRYREHLEELVHARTADLSLAKEAAEAASRAKNTFLANMSHELRTPMNAIMGMTGLVLRKIADPKVQDQLGKVLNASQHLLVLINDILDISKIEAERFTLERKYFQLGKGWKAYWPSSSRMPWTKGLISLPICRLKSLRFHCWVIPCGSARCYSTLLVMPSNSLSRVRSGCAYGWSKIPRTMCCCASMWRIAASASRPKIRNASSRPSSRPMAR